MSIIEDGTGKGYNAKVDVHNRIQSFATSVSEQHEKTVDGQAYTIGTTAPITINGTDETAIFYFKNNDDDVVVVTNTFILVSGVTSTADVAIIRNPISIIPDTGAKGGAITNSNFGSTNIANVTAIDGGEGAVFENGQGWNYYRVGNQPYFQSVGPFILPKGASFGVSVFPPSDNTGMTINIGFSFYTDKKHD